MAMIEFVQMSSISSLYTANNQGELVAAQIKLHLGNSPKNCESPWLYHWNPRKGRPPQDEFLAYISLHVPENQANAGKHTIYIDPVGRSVDAQGPYGLIYVFFTQRWRFDAYLTKLRGNGSWVAQGTAFVHAWASQSAQGNKSAFIRDAGCTGCKLSVHLLVRSCWQVFASKASQQRCT